MNIIIIIDTTSTILMIQKINNDNNYKRCCIINVNKYVHESLNIKYMNIIIWEINCKKG